MSYFFRPRDPYPDEMSVLETAAYTSFMVTRILRLCEVGVFGYAIDTAQGPDYIIPRSELDAYLQRLLDQDDHHRFPHDDND